ncbi:hypothetical protein ABB37_00701 [Leptomonas pyrrhocoris]|uniref:Uncharacterized protein n=1 Tax=Leptomonas pyrrhocoris TaxID=157538 RepID=A0A0N0E0K9_LEPPY|nr:hypothetical protein ABB37_00701 [Leptomonas pyrrhocoris]KPA86565.1 hypothetical protein ABB37_00701 [Leptomonas pyrrhocoris]|eukprot:XP_015665004.1 hypothetical protein ABB37_00701 [Leptomonas pyrrhocoris]
MSLTATNPEDQRNVALLQDLLQKREYHLAELIDEVVFAEQERFKAVQEAHSVRELANNLENAFDKLLQYHITMHKEVLLPALVASEQVNGAKGRRTSTSRLLNGEAKGEENNDTDDGSGTATPSNDFLNDLLNDPQLSRETKQLLQAVMQQRNGRSAVTPTPQPATPLLSTSAVAGPFEGGRAPAEANKVARRATHRAIVLSDSLLQNQEKLAQLLRSIQDQAEDMLERWSKDGNAAAGSPAPRREDSNGVRTPVAAFRLANLYQHSDRAREIEAALRSVEEERDSLQRQLRERETVADPRGSSAAAHAEKEAWGKERVHLKQELAFAQQRALEEQARCRELKKQVAQLEQIAATSPIPPPPPSAAHSTLCANCEKTRAELKRKAADYHTAKAAWKTKEESLVKEVEALQHRIEEAAAVAGTARSLAPHSPPSTSAKGAAAESPRYPAGPSSERKIGQLEATVAAMKADLQIMEMRMSIVQDEREAERRRLLAAHEQERERLRRERNECQAIIDAMSHELQKLSRADAGVPAITSASF